MPKGKSTIKVGVKAKVKPKPRAKRQTFTDKFEKMKNKVFGIEPKD